MAQANAVSRDIDADTRLCLCATNRYSCYMIAFTKMQGLGNDFVVIDGTKMRFNPDRRLLQQLSDRRTGVGCDQILVIDPPPEHATGIDFGYRIFNADGSEVGQCGNGARCLARYVVEHNLSTKRHLRVKTKTSILDLIMQEDGGIRVNMGVPQFEPVDIPLMVDQRATRYALIPSVAGAEYFGAVSLGNPHAVFEVDDIDRAPVKEVGSALQEHPMFPERVNVGFVRFVDTKTLRLRTHERGVGETPACGSAACAAMVVGRSWGKIERRARVLLNGGELDIEWVGEGQPVWMTGPANIVFEGTFPWPT